MIHSLPPYVLCLAAIALSAVVSMYAVRKIIFITRNRKIYDTPDDTRKIHGAQIPSLGGIGIFIGYITVAAFFWPRSHYFMPFILASSVLLFFTGIYDDLMNMRPSKKLVAQLIASFITVYFGHIRIDTLNGLFGIGDLFSWPSIVATTVCCTFFINVFNFVDGIDGLAGVIAALYTCLLGCMFLSLQQYAVAGILFALMGATMGLMVYNVAPAKIYMGDTGSMLLGFTIFVFSVLFLDMYTNERNGQIVEVIHSAPGAMMIILSILFLPVYDAIRVFILRASRGISPLKADRTHLHYYLLDAGFTHSQSVLIIVTVNIVIIALGYLLQDMSPYITLAAITGLSSLMLAVIYRLRQKNRTKASVS